MRNLMAMLGGGMPSLEDIFGLGSGASAQIRRIRVPRTPQRAPESQGLGLRDVEELLSGISSSLQSLGSQEGSPFEGADDQFDRMLRTTLYGSDRTDDLCKLQASAAWSTLREFLVEVQQTCEDGGLTVFTLKRLLVNFFELDRKMANWSDGAEFTLEAFTTGFAGPKDVVRRRVARLQAFVAADLAVEVAHGATEAGFIATRNGDFIELRDPRAKDPKEVVNRYEVGQFTVGERLLLEIGHEGQLTTTFGKDDVGQLVENAARAVQELPLLTSGAAADASDDQEARSEREPVGASAT